MYKYKYLKYKNKYLHGGSNDLNSDNFIITILQLSGDIYFQKTYNHKVSIDIIKKDIISSNSLSKPFHLIDNGANELNDDITFNSNEFLTIVINNISTLFDVLDEKFKNKDYILNNNWNKNSRNGKSCSAIFNFDPSICLLIKSSDDDSSDDKSINIQNISKIEFLTRYIYHDDKLYHEVIYIQLFLNDPTYEYNSDLKKILKNIYNFINVDKFDEGIFIDINHKVLHNIEYDKNTILSFLRNIFFGEDKFTKFVSQMDCNQLIYSRRLKQILQRFIIN